MFGVPVYSQFLDLYRHLVIVLLQIQLLTKPEIILRIGPQLTKLWHQAVYSVYCLFQLLSLILYTHFNPLFYFLFFSS